MFRLRLSRSGPCQDKLRTPGLLEIPKNPNTVLAQKNENLERNIETTFTLNCFEKDRLNNT